MAERARPPRFRWLAASGAISMPSDWLEWLGGGSSNRTLAWAVLIGVAAGAFWYWSYPRPLAKRLAPLSIVYSLTIVFVIIGLVGGGNDVDPRDLASPGVVTAIAVLWALVMSEQVQRWRRDFRDELAVLESADG